MCISLQTGLQIGGAILSYGMQSRNADAQRSAYADGYAAQMADLPRQYGQVNEQAIDKMGVRAREAMIERGRLAAIAADSGAGGGVSVTRIENESRFTEGTDVATIDRNRKNALDQIYAEAKGAQSNTYTRMSGISSPSLLGTGLQIAGAYFDGQDRDEARKRKTGKV